MREGLSTNRQCSDASCLRDAGKTFVVRYHSRTTSDPQKRISPKEAADLARADLDIATVYQDRGRKPEDFGLERGQLDGQSAQAFAAQIGQPPGSAVYFAVDWDFSAAEVADFVEPYFEGVKRGMDKAAGGTSSYDIGVYGSGLVCKLIRDNDALAKYAWLAESTGWRGSADFDTWDTKQHLNEGESLCSLGTGWERCEARESFGQFRPIGFDVQAQEGDRLRVNAPQLNLRVAPTTVGNTPVAVLAEGQEVRKLGAATSPWLRVRATLGGSDVVGYASGKFLSPVASLAAAPAAVPELSADVPPVHFRENDPESRRNSTSKRAQPIGEVPRPARQPNASPVDKVKQIGAIVDWLAVSSSERYKRDQVTYCNVYAADFSYLCGVYLPRTWWMAGALMQIAKGQVPPVEYGKTIREMRADDIHAWLLEFGEAYGWRRVFDATALQTAANSGGLGVICADREADGKPGHITIVVPESGTNKAERDPDSNVILPLQSQAGASNFEYSTIGRQWWTDELFRSYVFFVHD